MEVMLKRPGGDVTSETAFSHSAKRRRAQIADVSVTPAANDAVSDSDAVVAAPPVANDVVYGSDDVIFVASAADVVVNIGDVSVSPATNDVVSVVPPENGVVAESDGGCLTHSTVNGVVLVTNDVWTPADDDGVALSELTRLLDLNTAVETPVTCLTFAENTSTSAVVFQTMSTSYITINGNEESCGSSFSDNDSSVMVSFYCNNNNNNSREKWCTTAEEEDEQRGWLDLSAWDTDDAEMVTWARELDEEEDWDDATLARFLGEDIN